MRGLGRERQCGTTASPCIRSGARPGTLIFHARVKARPSTDGTPLWERDVYAPGSARSRVGPGSRRLSWRAQPFTKLDAARRRREQRRSSGSATAPLAPQMGEERPHHLLQIDPVALGAPGTTVHLDAGRVDLMIDDVSFRQPSVQQVAVKASFV